MLRAIYFKGLPGFILIILFSQCLSSQTLAHRYFTVREGLVQSQTDAFFMDSRGYLWIATRGGLCRFNGESFHNYHLPTSLPGVRILAVDEDAAGNIYVLNQFGIYRFDGVDFETVLQGQKYKAIQIDVQNRLWILKQIRSDPQYILEVYDITNGLKEISLPITEKKELLRPYSSLTLVPHPDGTAIIARDRSLETKIIPPSLDTLINCSLNGCMKYLLDIYCTQNSKYKCDIQIDQLFKGCIKLDEKIFWSAVAFFPENRYQKLDNELILIDHSSHSLYIINLLENKCNTYDLGLKESFYRHYVDSFQHIWVGTENGFFELFQPFIKEYRREKLKLSWNMVSLSKDSILFAPHSKTVALKTGESLYIIDNICSPDSPRFYMGNHELKDGRIVLSSDMGLNIIDKELACKTVYTPRGNWKRSITIQDLTVDENKSKILGAVLEGIAEYAISPDSIFFKQWILFDDPELRGIYSNTIKIDSDNGNYWSGHEKGLSIYDTSRAEWQHYSTQHENFPAGDVAAIYEDRYQTNWLGSAQGLISGTEEEGFQLIDDPLVQGVVNSIDSFDHDHIILGGTFGICILNITEWHNNKQIRGKIFNHSNGFMAGETADNAIHRMKDGSLMIGTQSYPVQLFPERTELKVIPLRSRILSINDSLLPFQHDTLPFHLPYKIDEVRIDFEAIGMYRPGPTRYSYRIDQGSWSEWKEESFLTLSDLGSGAHSFALKTQTPGIDPAQYPISKLSFVTSVPFWMEPHFAEVLGGLLGAAILALGILAFMNHKQRQRNHKHALAIDYLRIQSLQSQMNPHFVFNVLGTLQNMVLKADTKSANQQLVKLSTLIRRFLESTVQNNLHEGDSRIREHSLEEELELLELYIQFEQLQHRNLFEYEIILDPDLEIVSYSLPPMLIQPFVENAIKHGLMYKEEKGTLSIHFYQEKNKLVCKIEDDGVGREKALEIQQSSLRIYRSYGTKLVEERIELLNKKDYDIKYFIEDRQEGGTRVTIKLG